MPRAVFFVVFCICAPRREREATVLLFRDKTKTKTSSKKWSVVVRSVVVPLFRVLLCLFRASLICCLCFVRNPRGKPGAVVLTSLGGHGYHRHVSSTKNRDAVVLWCVVFGVHQLNWEQRAIWLWTLRNVSELWPRSPAAHRPATVGRAPSWVCPNNSGTSLVCRLPVNLSATTDRMSSRRRRQ